MPIFDCHLYLGGSYVPGVAQNGAALQRLATDRGLNGALVYSRHAERVDPVAGNRILKATIEQQPNLFGCLVTHVNRVDASIAAMREMMSHPRVLAMAIVGTRPQEAVHRIVADDIINAYRRFGKPLMLFVHNASMAEGALEIARTFNMLKVVLVGMGGEDWQAAINVAHATTNVMLEASGPLDIAKLPAAVERLGSHRVLFGSGAPHTDPAAAIGLLHDSPLSEEARSRILYQNAQRLFNLA